MTEDLTRDGQTNREREEMHSQQKQEEEEREEEETYQKEEKTFAADEGGLLLIEAWQIILTTVIFVSYLLSTPTKLKLNMILKNKHLIPINMSIIKPLNDNLDY